MVTAVIWTVAAISAVILADVFLPVVGPFIVRKRWWTPPFGKRVLAITLHPFVFIRAPFPLTRLRHELVHVHQVRRDGWVEFYVGYVWAWLWHRIRYRNLPAEIEARAHERDLFFLPRDLERIVAREIALRRARGEPLA